MTTLSKILSSSFIDKKKYSWKKKTPLKLVSKVFRGDKVDNTLYKKHGHKTNVLADFISSSFFNKIFIIILFIN